MSAAKAFTLLRDRFSHKAGTTCYQFTRNTFGLSSDDERATGIEHTCVTLRPDGDYPFFTVPVADLAPVVISKATGTQQ